MLNDTLTEDVARTIASKWPELLALRQRLEAEKRPEIRQAAVNILMSLVEDAALSDQIHKMSTEELEALVARAKAQLAAQEQLDALLAARGSNSGRTD